MSCQASLRAKLGALASFRVLWLHAAEKVAALKQAAEVAGRVQQGNELLQTLTVQAQKEAEEVGRE